MRDAGERRLSKACEEAGFLDESPCLQPLIGPVKRDPFKKEKCYASRKTGN
jgi:hypothetical protein